MFRYLQAIAHAKARSRGSLSPEQARAGLAEFKASGRSYKSLPASKGKGRK